MRPFKKQQTPILFLHDEQLSLSMSNRLNNILHKPRSKAHHLLRAKRANGRGIHSPYLFRFVTIVLNTKWPFYAFDELETVHNEQKSRYRHLIKFRKKEKHPVERLIFRIVQDLQPATMLEVGNPKGIDTQYMVNASPNAQCMSISYAQDINNVSTLKEMLMNVEKLDFVLFNRPTDQLIRENEFQSCLLKAHQGSIFVVKNIHQNPQQSFTWKIMRNHPQVQASIDIFSIGILFFRNDLPKCSLLIKT